MTRQFTRRIGGSRLVQLALATCLTLASLPALGVGVAYLPDADAEEILGGRPDLSLLTWQLPHGVLIADRVADGHTTRFGVAFPSMYPSSEWFLVQGTGHAHDGMNEALHGFGKVHLRDGEAVVVEIPRDRLAEFDRLTLDKNRILLSPPPSGWDRQTQTVQAPAHRDKRNEDLIPGFLAQIDELAFYQIIQEISGATYFWLDDTSYTVATRYYTTTDKVLVRNYLSGILETYGYTVELDYFTYNGHDCWNIVATRLGTMTPDEYVILGGHYDSTSPLGPTLAPGAEDNGSGTSLVMEVARIAADREFEKSVQFVLFDSEEQGLNGSYHFVEEAVAEGRNIIAAITADMVTWYSSNYAVIIEGQSPWEWLMSIMEENVTAFTPLGHRKDYFSWGSDHVPFQQAGIPAFLAIDWDWNNYPYYHTISDTWSNISATAEIGYEITKACAATLAVVAVLQTDLTGIEDGLPAPVARLRAYPNPFNPQGWCCSMVSCRRENIPSPGTAGMQRGTRWAVACTCAASKRRAPAAA
jgi:hypothetical protein